MAAVDYFLKLDGIDGESTDDKHKNEIEIESFSWGVTQTGSHSAGGGGGAGKAVFQDFHFTAKLSKASPILMLSCATGEHIKKAVLTVRKAGSEQPEYFKVTLQDLLVSSYSLGGAGGGDTSADVVPTDQFSLNFAKVELDYTPQGGDGSGDGPVKAGYDLKLNKKI